MNEKPPVAQPSPQPSEPMRTRFQDALGRYWSLAFAEGKEGRDQDTEDGAAQETLHELLSLFDARHQSERAGEAVQRQADGDRA